MEVITNIPFELNHEELIGHLGLESDSSAADRFKVLAKKASRVAKPKVVYLESFIEAKEYNTVCINGITFTSRILAVNFENIERIFPFVGTCGHEIDNFSPSKEKVQNLWLEAIKMSILKTTVEFLIKHIQKHYLLQKLSMVNPGSGDEDIWPIEQQKGLFALLGDVEGKIGVRLLDSYLMSPGKTVSGILFPTEKDYRNCMVCKRENCPGRSAPFNEKLWQSIHK